MAKSTFMKVPCCTTVALSLYLYGQMVTRNGMKCTFYHFPQETSDVKGCSAPYFILVDGTGCFCVVTVWTEYLSLSPPEPDYNNFLLSR